MNSGFKSDAIAPGFVEGSNMRLVYSALLVVFGIATLALSAKIQVPFWPVPMTLQTLAIMGIAAAYGSRLGIATVLAYLAAGFAGAPVFAGPVSGPAYFAGPTAGFLAGFVLIALIVGYAADKGWAKNPFKLFGSMLVADALCFLLGFVWLGFMFISAKSGTTLGAEVAFNAGVKPYILADLVKIAIAAAIIPAIGNLVRK
jgi:biotin transport system substrate-specific component